jgi:hypothetical protein
MSCLGAEDCPAFTWVNPPLGLSFAGLATGGAVSIIALIVIMAVSVLSIIGHALRLLGKSIKLLGFTAFVANWAFVADAVLALIAVLAFPIAFGVDNGPPVETFGMTATTGVGVTVLIILLALIHIVVRFVPPLYSKLRYSNALLAKPA